MILNFKYKGSKFKILIIEQIFDQIYTIDIYFKNYIIINL